MRSFDFVIAKSDAQRAEAQRLRYLVYGQEEGMLAHSSAGETGSLVDLCDPAASTAHILVYDGDRAVGTARLAELGAFGSLCDQFQEHLLARRYGPISRFAAVGRFCVLRQYRGTRVVAAVHAGLTAESRRRGITHWLAVGNTETDCPHEAALIYRIAEAQGLLCADLEAPATSLRCPGGPCTRHVYTHVQREQAAVGSLVGLRLPRTLALFAKWMGARFAGPPLYDPTCRIFAMPLVTTPLDL